MAQPQNTALLSHFLVVLAERVESESDLDNDTNAFLKSLHRYLFPARYLVGRFASQQSYLTSLTSLAMIRDRPLNLGRD